MNAKGVDPIHRKPEVAIMCARDSLATTTIRVPAGCSAGETRSIQRSNASLGSQIASEIRSDCSEQCWQTQLHVGSQKASSKADRDKT